MNARVYRFPVQHEKKTVGGSQSLELQTFASVNGGTLPVKRPHEVPRDLLGAPMLRKDQVWKPKKGSLLVLTLGRDPLDARLVLFTSYREPRFNPQRMFENTFLLQYELWDDVPD